MSLEDVLSLQVALLNFASKVYPNRLDYLDDVMSFSVQMIQQKSGDAKLNDKNSKYVVSLLTSPVETISLEVFQLQHFGSLMEFLGFEPRKQVALLIAKSVLNSRTILAEPDRIKILFDFISPLTKDAADTPTLTHGNQYEFEEEQYVVCRLVHLVRSEDPDLQYKLLVFIRNAFAEGGEQRYKFTFPPLIFCALELVDRVLEENSDDGQIAKAKKIFQFVHKVTSVIAPLNPLVGSKLFLQAALKADRYNLDNITYEFLTQAFTIYEEEVSGSKEIISMLYLIMGTVQSLRQLDEENYDTMAAQTTQAAARLLKKDDKVRAIIHGSHLFWTGSEEKPATRKGNMVIACLQKGLKIANSVMEPAVKARLFIEILEKYVYFFERNVPEVSFFV
jgi:vacuolar protein sorting-associated protein 35